MRLFTSIILLLCSFLGNAQCSVPTLATAYNSNNGQRGAMFDVVAINDITITCIDANLYAGTTGNYEIYYKTGSFVGSETTAAAWTLAGGATGVTSLGNNVATPIPIALSVAVTAGQTVAFYVTNDFGAGTSYTDGTGANINLATNADFSILGGVGKSYPFGLTFSYRLFNGTIHYISGVLPIELTSFTATAEENKTKLQWETISEKDNDFFSLERSVDGVNWTLLSTIKGKGNSSEQVNYEFIDDSPESGVNYYKLSQTDYDGAMESFDIRAVNFSVSKSNELIVYPNPASEQVTIAGSSDDLLNLQVFDLMGRIYTDDINTKQNPLGMELDISKLPNGFYLVKTNGSSSTFVKQ